MNKPKHALPTLDKLHVLDEHGGRKYVYPADVHGRFTRWKPLVFAVLIAVYAALPWIQIGGHPAVLIDIPMRRFYLLGKTFNAQDFYLFFFVLTGIGFTLIVLSALFGRVWCGWACPQTVFLEGVFRRVERWIEGPAAHRAALARGPMTAGVFFRKLLKHAIYLVLSFVVAHIFLSYFVSMRELLVMIRQRPSAHLTAFLWAFGMTAVVYWNFFWFREQLCLVICPYGRLQSALQDRDTIVIGYDSKRGEPRGKATEAGVGDCVDCRRCIAVCPTAIDIRNGLQMECVGCANCIDACDEIMGKLGREPGLIRYDSERGLTEGKRRFFRPRLLGYTVAGLLGLTVATVTWIRHMPFEANVVRAVGLPYVLDGDVVRNQATVHLINKNPGPSDMEIAAAPGQQVALLISQPRLTLPSLGSQQVPVVLTVRRADFRRGMTAVLLVTDGASGTRKELRMPVLGPTVGAR
jgi:cytochrome c oxidase accessory protein FixG